MAAISIMGGSNIKIDSCAMINCGTGLRYGGGADIEIKNTRFEFCDTAIEEITVNPVMTEESKAIFEELKRMLAALDKISTNDKPEALQGVIKERMEDLCSGEKPEGVVKKIYDRFGSIFEDVAKKVAAGAILQNIHKLF